MRECRFLPFTAARCAARSTRLSALLTISLAGVLVPAQNRDRVLQPVNPARVQALAAHHPLWATPANDAGVAPADLQLNQLTLVLTRSDQQEQALEQLLAEQQNPASPEYHHWLTAEQVGQRFGISAHDLALVRAWLESQGLHVNWVAPARNFLGFGGPVVAVDRAFGTELHSYRVNGATRLSVASDPRIPQALTPAIAAVRGLYSIQDQPAHLTQLAHASPDVSNGGNHYISPGDFATLYDLPSNLGGAGVTIGIVGWSFINLADLDNFRRQTGASFADPAEVVPTSFGGVNPGAPYSTPPACANNCLSGQEEATLDVLRAASVAPDASVLLVSSAPSGANDGIGPAAQYLIQSTPAPAQIVNISFGDCESDAGSSGVAYWNKLFQQAAAEGISVFVSSGDSGAAGCDTAFAAPPHSPAAVSANYICASPYATCVGGTSLNDAADPSVYWSSSNGAGLASALSYIPEGGWNEPLTYSAQVQVAASGGGVSRYIAMPSYQQGVIGVPAAHAGRYTPDVSFAASCREGYFGCLAAAGGSCVADSNGNYNFVTFCGTSATAPALAGIAALLDQQIGGKAQGNLNPRLYALSAGESAVFHDVTVASSGASNCALTLPSVCNNSAPGTSTLSGGEAGYLVGAGYDEVTGLGSLDVQSLLRNFSPTGAIVNAPQTPSFTVSGGTVSIARGATSGNSKITVTPLAGFTGAVTLTAQITSSPFGAKYPPLISFGATSPVQISGTHAAVATMTISTVTKASTVAQSTKRETASWYASGGAAMACLVLIWLPDKRSWRAFLGAVLLFAALGSGAVGCSANLAGVAASVQSASGTTAGTYTITVTATCGAAVVATPVTLIVQ